MRSLFGTAGFSSKPTTAPVVVELGDPEALRVGHPVEERPGAPRPGLELAGERLERRAVEDVVSQDAAERVVADEVPGEADRMGDPQRSALVAVRQAEPEVLSVAEELHDVTDALAADDDEDFADPHPGQRLERVVDHRPVVDREQVLVRHDGEREQPRRRAAGEDDPLHGVTSYGRRVARGSGVAGWYGCSESGSVPSGLSSSVGSWSMPGIPPS